MGAAANYTCMCVGVDIFPFANSDQIPVAATAAVSRQLYVLPSTGSHTEIKLILIYVIISTHLHQNKNHKGESLSPALSLSLSFF